MRNAERFTTSVAHHGEGPFWDPRSNRLMCMDVLAGTVVAVDPDGALHRYPIPSRVATVIRRRRGSGFVIGTERGLVVADDELATFEHFAEVTTDDAVRTNDGGCDPLGGFVVGTMSYDEEPGAGSVYRVTSDHGVAKVLASVSISNGVQWSADGTKVFYIDTPTQRVDVFDVEPTTGAWSGRRAHIHTDHPAGSPDGMAIDEDDGLWIALWGAGAVVHYDRHGKLADTITVPGVSQVSSCAFGGMDGTDLFITTSRQGLDPDREPDAGAVFRVPTSVRGAAQAEFAG